jgi:ribonuclease HII
MLQRCLNKHILEAGCDEAGRGCLAGPVFAAAVILPEDFECEALNDSKQLTEKQRFQLRPLIESKATAWAIGVVSAGEIDQINILNASFLAMHRAISELKSAPDFLLIDGNRFRRPSQIPAYKTDSTFEELRDLPLLDNIPFKCEVKGDGRFMNIAAASILAKTYRDDFMLEIHQKYPQYHWNSNKGYPTQDHRKAIREFGSCEFHRTTFRLLKNQLNLNFEF